MTSCFLGDRPGTCLAGAVRATTVLLQPIGAFEHHGPHLPLHTDAIVVDELARVLVRDRPELGLMVLPTLSYGLSSEHVWAAGTVSLNPATLLAVLDDLASSVVRAGIDRLAFLNGHGGNTHLLRVACREMRVRHGLLTFLLQPALPPDNGGPPGDPREEGLGIHGGLGETSMMMHLRPELVELEKAEPSLPAWLRGYTHLGFGRAAEFGWTSQDLCESGVIGDPTLASAELGRQRFELAVATVGDALAEVAAFDFPGPAAPGRGIRSSTGRARRQVS